MQVEKTSIYGLLHITLDVHADDRGSFREAWQDEKMRAAGLPMLGPVQWNISVSQRGVLRGIHAEPWDKYIHPAYGTVFAAIVDLRPESPTYRHVATFDLDQTSALFIPRGCGNSFQITSEIAVYAYLVNAHWQAGTVYPGYAWDDPTLAISWPIVPPILSPKDSSLPNLDQ